jgi:hypothetical protein
MATRTELRRKSAWRAQVGSSVTQGKGFGAPRRDAVYAQCSDQVRKFPTGEEAAEISAGRHAVSPRGTQRQRNAKTVRRLRR